jgi:hypothetical protein
LARPRYVGRLGIGLTVLVIAAIVGIGYFLLAKGGFSDADIAATKADIRAKFEERNGIPM